MTVGRKQFLSPLYVSTAKLYAEDSWWEAWKPRGSTTAMLEVAEVEEICWNVSAAFQDSKSVLRFVSIRRDGWVWIFSKRDCHWCG